MFGVKVRGFASIGKFRVEQGVAGHPGIQSDAHEPGPERLSGEPLLQPADHMLSDEGR